MMISKKLSRVTLVVAAAMVFYSCDRQERVPEPQSAELKKLENPYTVANMREAWQNIKPELDATKQTNSLGSGFDIGTTHLYVKFKPKNEQELDMLNADTTIYLYSYPLDVEIPEGLTNYRHPEVPDGQPTYQYASVPYNYNFPDVEHEVLEELFLPDQLDQVSSLYLPMDPCLELQLTNEAMRITDNTDLMVYPEEPCGGGGGGGGGPVGCSYCPQGRIRLQDDVLRFGWVKRSEG
jgi:hypothetical protein